MVLKQKGSATLIVFLVLLILIIIGAGVYYYWQHQKAAKIDLTTEMLGKKTADETSDWQTYQNPQYPYSFKYPKDWYFITSGLNLPPPVTVMVADMPEGSDMTKYTSFSVFAVDSGGQTLENYPEVTNLEAQGEKKTATTVSGQPAYKFEYSDVTYFTTSIYTKYKNQIYRIGWQISLKLASGTVSEKKLICEKILGTFTFGENGNAADTNVSEEIQVGSVTLDSTKTKQLQESVDQGHQPLYLDPVEVARMEGVQYRFSLSDEFSLIDKSYADAAGTYIALVKAVHNGVSYTIQLIQPETQGDKGIWAINNISKD